MKQFRTEEEARAAGQKIGRQFNRINSTGSLPKFRAEDDGDDGLEDEDDEACTETLGRVLSQGPRWAS